LEYQLFFYYNASLHITAILPDGAHDKFLVDINSLSPVICPSALQKFLSNTNRIQ